MRLSTMLLSLAALFVAVSATPGYSTNKRGELHLETPLAHIEAGPLYRSPIFKLNSLGTGGLRLTSSAGFLLIGPGFLVVVSVFMCSLWLYRPIALHASMIGACGVFQMLSLAKIAARTHLAAVAPTYVAIFSTAVKRPLTFNLSSSAPAIVLGAALEIVAGLLQRYRRSGMDIE
ncbi:hypothetical protein C8R47DRAFT_1189666 [Mycena vitilis]|nr:hypothetical protein C8R47DRAFT_1189666 [Mycena vitilis]